MWHQLNLVFSCCISTLIATEVLFDVTTIYDLNSPFKPGAALPGRIHSRTNTRGLRLQCGNNRKITPKTFLFNNDCDGILCGWNIQDWVLSVTNNSNGRCSISEHQCHWYKEYSHYNSDYGDRYCMSKTGGDICNHRTKCTDGSDEKYCSVSDCEGFLCHSKSKCLPPTWQCDGHKDCEDGSDEKECQQFVSVNTPGRVLISPEITPTSQQCLALVVYSTQPPGEEILRVLASNSSGIKHSVGVIHSASQAGWQVAHINVSFPQDIVEPVKLVIQSVSNNEVRLFQVSGCSSDGEDVTDVFFMTDVTDKSNFKQILPVCSVSVDKIDNAKLLQDSKSACFNGGKATSAGCACPPGFTGPKCEIGCGKYRFGQDCGGLCSLFLQGCMGKLMCNPFYNCMCAPGYKGDTCTETCSSGWYGNDCLQSCGKCADGEACNIYTGRCPRCQGGFVPPLCQQEYVYYSSKPSLSTDFGKITVTFNPKKFSGVGTPVIYQIQYAEPKALTKWINLVTKILPVTGGDSLVESNISEDIVVTEHGKNYRVRILLMDSSYNKYDSDLVQVAQVLSKCSNPKEYDYKIEFETHPNSLKFSWSYETQAHWCPIDSFEIYVRKGWQQLINTTKNHSFILEDIVPGTQIEFKVRASTSDGFAPFSQPLIVSTLYNDINAVDDVKVVSTQSTFIDLAWKAPLSVAERNLTYKVTFKCVQQPACMPGCVDAAEGILTENKTNVTLSPLLPFAQYQVTVTPEGGPPTSFYVGTSMALPTEVPTVSSEAVVRSNTSLTVFWEPVPVCSGFLLGYNYQLLKESESVTVMDNGFTTHLNASFHNLTANTEYTVKVFIKTIVGWNPHYFLTVKTSTSATVPEAVRNLTVYKRSRSSLGVRWAAPKALYGTLKSFSMTYGVGGSTSGIQTVEPKPCVPWPHLFCHTVEGLLPNRNYTIEVRARNAEIAESGEGLSISTLTKESSPTAPEDLAIVKRTSTSLGLQWHYPDLANGIIRSFVISVEETEKHDQESCCQVFPLVEIPVQEELPLYEAEVTGLYPASTYYLSVTAKTVGLGPSRAIVAYTRPPQLTPFILPSLNLLQGPVVTAAQDVSWSFLSNMAEVNKSELYTPLVKIKLLLAISNATTSDSGSSGISDAKLNSLLKESVDQPFYFLGEYNQDGMVTDSAWGNPHPLESGQSYRLAAAQVTEYNGVYNTGLAYSSWFTM